jgi:site-specific DNA-methyltransferase (adenine-specific)
MDKLPLDQVLLGECVEVLNSLPPESVDLVFADPPYNLQLRQDLRRPNLSLVDRVDDAWDQFADFAAYDAFTRAWLNACRRVLKRTGTLWVIGSYHNIYRVGAILQELDYWILNNVAWIKQNPMPNFRGVRFTNAHESLIWAQKEHGAQYTFNHHAMKSLNEDLQMRSDWYLPLCTGRERVKFNGEKAHPTQKPEALLYRVILSSSNEGDVVLDPFFGTGTTGAVARRLKRRWIGVELDPHYVDIARQRIENTPAGVEDPEIFHSANPRREARLPFGALLENGLIQPGDVLYYGAQGQITARVMADSTLECQGSRGSIHAIARILGSKPSIGSEQPGVDPGPGNGWQAWFYCDRQTGQRRPIDHLRQELRQIIQELPKEGEE